MRKSINLMLKNSFKNAFSSWSQFVGLILLITTLSIVISLMSSISIRVVDNYNDLADSSNLRTLVVDMPPSTFVGGKDDKDAPDNIVEAQQHYIYKLNNEYEGTNLEFNWSRTEGRNFSGLKNNQHDLKVKAVAKTTPNKLASLEKVDSLAVSEGNNIKSKNQVVLDATFAKKNNVKIGDIIRLQEDTLGDQLQVKSDLNSINKSNKDIYNEILKIKNLDDENDIYNQEFSNYKWFQVVGYGESIDYVLPVIDEQSTLPNKETEAIVYVDPINFGLIKDENSEQGFYLFDQARSVLSVASSNDSEAYYSLKLRDGRSSGSVSDNEVSEMNKKFLKIIGKENRGNELKFIYKNDDSDYKYSSRTMSIISTLKIYNLIASIILILILAVTIFTVVLVTKKQIEKTRSQIGLMKALGYRKRQIVFNFIALPFITSLMGGIFGFVAAQFIQIPIIKTFSTYFNLDFTAWSFDIVGFIVVVVLMWFIISAVSFIIAYQIMKKDTLTLIGDNKASKIGRVGQAIKKMNPKNTTDSKMKFALLATSMGKMAVVGSVVLIATTIMTLTFSSPTILKNNQVESYTGIKYKQLVEYSEPVYNDPYTFMKTYNAQAKANDYNYSKELNKITALPLLKTTYKDDDYSKYDMNKIFKQLESGNIPNEFYGLEFDAGKGGTPNSMQILLANMKMLNPYSIVLNDNYFKTISDFANLDPFGWNILNNQWPDYLKLVQRIQDNEAKLSINPSENELKEFYKNQMLELQSFYKVYSESVGLTITRDYYNYNTTDKGAEAYKEHDYVKQINLFNDKNNFDNIKKAFSSFKTEKKNGQQAFGDKLTELNFDNKTFKITNGENPEFGKLPMNRIYSDKQKDPNKLVDQYLVANPDEMNINEIKSYISDYLTWYGTFFSKRSGTAIVQAGFTRPPYFVQQYFKDAYFSKDKRYNFAFSTVSYNPGEEQLGVKIKAESKDLIHGSPVSFNIYGIENNDKFLELKDKKNNDLIDELYKNKLDNDNSIVINESLARKLQIKKGEIIDLNVINKELKNLTKNEKYKVSDWKQDNVRQKAKDENFISTAAMDTLGVSVKTPGTDNYVKMSVGSTNINNEPGDLYKNYLDGEVAVVDTKNDKKFKVVGIHNGYGVPQAWIKNESAKKIMNYNETQEYLWDTLFAQQFAKEFTKEEYKQTGYYFNNDLRKLNYATFKHYFVENEDSPYNETAIKIDTMFNNLFPIFNFKFSMNDDIGDMQSGVSTYTELGDYSPITMNGGIVNKKTYDGIGVGGISTLMPIQISKNILEQMNHVIMIILIMLITLTIVVAFVIILLTISVIIKDNMRFISTLKVLGYTNKSIVNFVVGMYAIVIVVMFAIGFVIGWFALSGIISQMAISTSFVLPLHFMIWLPFAVAAGVVGIYLITFAVAYYYIGKANATHVLQNQEL